VDELVRQGARVTALDNLSTGRKSNLDGALNGVDLRETDLRHDDLRPLLARGQFHTIFHTAGSAYVPLSVENPRQDLEDNVLATFNLLGAMRDAATATRLVNVSTAAVYGEGGRMPIREVDPTVPVSPYGVSKLAAELYVAVWSRLFGIRAATVRLFPVFGPRLRKQVIYDLMRKIHSNPHELFIHGDGTQARDFNHAANVVRALLLVAERGGERGDVYNVAAESPVTIAELARLICEAMGVSPRFVYSGEVRPGDAQRWNADITKLKELGYEPSVSFEDGLRETVAWFREEMATDATT